MPSKPPQISNLRPDEAGIRGAFEEFCCQLFRRMSEVQADSVYRRIRGDGGDGGVEATWTLPDGKVWGLQAKFFDALESKHKAQLTESVRQAVASYPQLTRYILCFPFNLTATTGAKAGKKKSGQYEKLSEWIAEWQSELATKSRSVQFEIWNESELLGRLAVVDVTGGLRRYWFDQEIMTSAWFAERLNEAAAQAGPRYSPRLNIITPMREALQAFGRSELWANKIKALSEDFTDKLSWWRNVAEGKIEPIISLPKDAVEEAKKIVVITESLELGLENAVEEPDFLTATKFRDAVKLTLELGNSLEPKIKKLLIEKHGVTADSPGFRQWRAEYMADFPMASLDHLRDLLKILGEIEVLAFQPEGQLPAATCMLIRGEAGIGKTHGILDAANQRQAMGLRSLVVFGEDVAGADPWQAIISKIGLGSDLGRDAVLDALNSAGEVTGLPLVIFIDAINETEPDRRKWQSWLPPMLEQIKRRPFLKLCVSCRGIYVRETIPPGIGIPIIEHNGFLGHEYEALLAFFKYYKLGAPAEPLLQEEFANPLFLRLVCEALSEVKMPALPAGREGIRSIINLLFNAKNERASRACDYDHRENRVNAAMLRLAGAMAENKNRKISLTDARILVDGATTAQSQSLFAVLEAESLISLTEHSGNTLGAQPSYQVRFTFERVGDHLITEHLLSGIKDVSAAFSDKGSLRFLIANNDAIQANAGILEAISIQLPETHATELMDVLDDHSKALLWGSFISGLHWRNPEFITNRTISIVRSGLMSSESMAIIEALCGVAAQPGHPLNALFLHEFLESIAFLGRDPWWSYHLEKSYSGWSEGVNSKSAVYRLIEAARYSNLENLPDDAGKLWATALAWFCASPDRRIRDRATMALVNIFLAKPACIADLLKRFLLSEDEYVSERVLVAAYGALLLNNSESDAHSAADIVYKLYFLGKAPPLNASLRDHGRLIIEISVDLGVPPKGIKTSLYRPPYKSPWPISLPTEESVKPYISDRERFPQMNLVEQVGYALGTDFARYVIEPRVTSAFDINKANLDKVGIFRWFLDQAIKLGYPGPGDRCAQFDLTLLSQYGGGRGKPGWAERLGKKYYWIFLRQLVGQMADHLDKKVWGGNLPPSIDLQGLDLRDIDPTDIREYLPAPNIDHAWHTPVPYIFNGREIPEEDNDWASSNDLNDVSKALSVTDMEGIEWQVIDMDNSWSGKRTGSKHNASYRRVTRSVRAATCDEKHIEDVVKSFTKEPLDHFNHGPHDYRGYLGEYPTKWPYTSRLEDPISFDSEDGGISFKYLRLQQLRGKEWERDYSHLDESKTLLMPSIDLARAGNLKWDRHGGWIDSHQQIQIQDPWWWNSSQPSGLICRMSYLDEFLAKNNLALIILGFQMKYIAGSMKPRKNMTERTLYIRHKGKTILRGKSKKAN